MKLLHIYESCRSVYRLPSARSDDAIQYALGARQSVDLIHKARNIIERLPKSTHAEVRRFLRQASKMDEADKGEQLLRNLTRRPEKDRRGVSASLLERLDEMLTFSMRPLPIRRRKSRNCQAPHANRER